MSELEKLQKLCREFRILYVEDENRLRSKVVAYLSKFFKDVDEAKDGAEGLYKYKKSKYDIVITDISMPNMGGLSMAKEIKKIDKTQKIIIVSAYSDNQKFLQSIKIGIDGYILKPFDYKQINEVIYKSASSLKESKDNERFKDRLLELVEEKVKEIQMLEIQKSQDYKDALYTLVDLIERRDPYTGGHSNRVAKYCKLIAQELKMSDNEIGILHEAAILHDIGKIAIPDSILLKPGKLDELEYEIIKKHVEIGYDVLRKYHIFDKISKIIKAHHERIDGSGYPDGLKGDEISLSAKVMAVADSFDAMTTDRIYQAKKTPLQALEEIDSLAGVTFDVKVARAAKKALKDIEITQFISQLPHDEIEEERFSYFYRDQLTRVHNKHYLDLALIKNSFSSKYTKLNMVFLKDFTSYNIKFGWDMGDIFLKKIALKLRKCFSDTSVFRLWVDDFALLGTEDMNFQEINKFCEENRLRCLIVEIDIQKKQIVSLDALAKYLREK